MVAPATGPLAEALAAIPVALGITRDFPAAVMAEAEAASAHPVLPDLDNTDVPFVTVDPAGSMDLDQALYLERAGDGYRGGGSLSLPRRWAQLQDHDGQCAHTDTAAYRNRGADGGCTRHH